MLTSRDIRIRINRVAVVSVSLAFFLFLLVVSTVPLLWGILTSLKPSNVILAFPPRIIDFRPTLEHYIRTIQSGFFKALFVSVFNSAGCIVSCVLLASFAAYGFDRCAFRFRKLLFFIIVVGIPLSAGSTALLMPNFLFFTRMGIADKRYTLILLYTVYQLPMSIWIMKGAFEAIPTAIDESATLEGCGNVYILFHFLLPLSKPAIAATAILAFIGSWNEFITASVMVHAERFRPVQLAIYNFLGYYGREWGPLTASATLAILPIIAVFFLLGRMLISGLTQGAVK